MLSGVKDAMMYKLHKIADRLNCGEDMDKDGLAGIDWNEWEDTIMVTVDGFEWCFNVRAEIKDARWIEDDNGEGDFWWELEDVAFDLTISDVTCYNTDGDEMNIEKEADYLERTVCLYQLCG